MIPTCNTMDCKEVLEFKEKKLSPRIANTVLHPELLETKYGSFEVSVHSCPRKMKRDVLAVFRNSSKEYEKKNGASFVENLLIIPTCQHANMNIVNYGDDVAEEKDTLLERFTAFSETICLQLEELGYWADFADPCSGLPMRSNGNVIYAEVQALTMLRNYTTMSVGACKVLLHPKWGTAVYPATMFTTAPYEVFSKLLSDLAECEEAKSCDGFEKK